MTRLRAGRTNKHRGRPVAAKVALDVAADHVFNHGLDLAAIQLEALTDAARFALAPSEALEAEVRGEGDCYSGLSDPEDWFLLDNADSYAPSRIADREVAERLCRGCPVLARCRALSFEVGSPGVMGGLSSGDRAELRPLWTDLRQRLSGPAARTRRARPQEPRTRIAAQEGDQS